MPDGSLQGSSEGDDYRLLPRKGWTPAAADLASLAGHYRSAEADAVLTVAVKDGKLIIGPRDRPSFTTILTPAYTDAFAGHETTARIKRGAGGRIDGLILSNARGWSLAFDKMADQKS